MIDTVELGPNAGGFLGDVDGFDEFGAEVAAIGDLDGDGVQELGVGAPGQFGAVYILFVQGFAHPSRVEPHNGLSSNPVCLSTNALPHLGSTWSLQVDASVQSGAFASAVVFSSEALRPGLSLPGFGELLIDPGPSLLFTVATPSGGGVDSLDVVLPANVALLGRVGHAQALVVGDATQACNALEITLGN